MITVAEAKSLIYKNTIPLEPISLQLENAAGLTLAEDIHARCDIPAFRQSSMDGYALKFEDRDKALVLAGEMAAGTTVPLSIQQGETCRIFTGAALPEGADTVVMQEKVILENDRIILRDDKLQKGANVREQGAEIKAAELAMKKGTSLSPAAIGFLAGTGSSELKVFPLPKVSIIVTGKELQKPGTALKFGQVYESSSYSLRAALRAEGILEVELSEADDHPGLITELLESALMDSDVVLMTGGVSVGDYDFVIEASQRCAVQQVFHKIKQKPGKPLFFGTKGRKLIFGLPGNPASVLSCYYNYVLPALKQLSQQQNSTTELTAKLSCDYQKPSGLTHFLKGSYANGEVSPLGAQESFRLSSFAQANCLICLTEMQELIKAGEPVSVILLPQ